MPGRPPTAEPRGNAIPGLQRRTDRDRAHEYQRSALQTWAAADRDRRRWLDFANFLADMGERPPGMTLERKDNDGPYASCNCIGQRRTITAEQSGLQAHSRHDSPKSAVPAQPGSRSASAHEET